jgi:hypothetical protein
MDEMVMHMNLTIHTLAGISISSSHPPAKTTTSRQLEDPKQPCFTYLPRALGRLHVVPTA